MSEDFDTSANDDASPQRSWGPRRRTSFALGILLGLVLGIAAAIVVPDLIPEGEPDCTLPEQVIWSQTDAGGARLEVDYADDGANGCDANFVFSERPQP